LEIRYKVDSKGGVVPRKSVKKTTPLPIGTKVIKLIGGVLGVVIDHPSPTEDGKLLLKIRFKSPYCGTWVRVFPQSEVRKI